MTTGNVLGCSNKHQLKPGRQRAFNPWLQVGEILEYMRIHTKKTQGGEIPSITRIPRHASLQTPSSKIGPLVLISAVGIH
jgi:hypothetical protein